MEDYVYDQMGKLAEATTGVAAAAEKALNAFGRKGQSGLQAAAKKKQYNSNHANSILLIG